MAQLRYLDDAGQIRTTELAAGRFVIGRIGSCNITFVDDMVSREHTEITAGKDGRYHVRDLGSRNKTHVNGETIAETVLAGGDVIRIGDRVLEFLDDSIAMQKIDLGFLTPDRTEPPGCEWIKIKAPVTLTLDQVSRLGGMSGGGTVVVRPEDMVESGLSHLIVETQAERGFVAIRGESRKDLRVVAHRGLNRPPGAGPMPVSQTFVYAALLQQVAGRYPETGSQIDAKAGYAATGMVAPLVHRGNSIGLIYVDRPTSKRAFSAAQLQQFTAAAAQLAGLTANATQRLAQSAAREGYVFMSHVRRVHAQLTPSIPQLPDFEVASQLLPGQGRCGDVCDVVGIEEGSACALVVDTGGHGVTGLAQAAAIRTALRTAMAVPGAVLDLGTVFSALNRSITGMPGRQFIACCAVHLDTRAGRLSYVNAGAPMPLLVPAPTRMHALDQPSLILGADPDYAFEATTVDLPPAFRLVLHTDGMVDACNAGGEPYGDERFRNALLEREAFTGPAEMVTLITSAFEEHLAGQPHDDDALVVVVGR